MRSSRSCLQDPHRYWHKASQKIQLYPSQTKRLLNSDYYGGCRHHGSYQPYIVCSANRVASGDIRDRERGGDERLKCGKVQREIVADRVRREVRSVHVRRRHRRDCSGR